MQAVLFFLIVGLIAGTRSVSTGRPIPKGILFVACVCFAIAMTSRRVI